ncbi:hypothetical protein [Spirosoma telluris]|uniref:hypothetical protein n=1 Tax=Spirosoma telluris TaxID=2183553 RepID=UPI002FC28425
MGVGNRFSYRNLSLSISLNGSYGNQIYFQGGEINLNGAAVQNQLATIADRWRSLENPGAGFYSRAIRNDYAFGISAGTTRYLFDGSYIRIRDVNLSYTFPALIQHKWKLQGLSVYADITNLYTFTKYPSYDPEGSTSGIIWPKAVSICFRTQIQEPIRLACAQASNPSIEKRYYSLSL